MTSMYDHPPKTPAAPAPIMRADLAANLAAGRAARLADLGARLYASIDECYDRHRRGLMTRAELVDRIKDAAICYDARARVVTEPDDD